MLISINTHFQVPGSALIKILVPLPGMGMVWGHVFINISSLFLLCRLFLQKLYIAEDSSCL